VDKLLEVIRFLKILPAKQKPKQGCVGSARFMQALASPTLDKSLFSVDNL